MRTLALAVVAACTLLSPAGAHAQANLYRGVEVWGGYAGWSGDDAATLDPGFQGGIAVFGELSEQTGFGLEAIYGKMDQGAEAVTELGAGVVIRRAFGSRDATHLFAQARAGWTRHSTDDTFNQALQDGVALGPELGVEIPFTRNLRFVLAAGATWRQYGDAHLFLGPAFEGTRGTAWRYGLRVGFAAGETP